MYASRRVFLQGACAAVSLAALSQFMPQKAFAAAPSNKIPLEACIAMTPKQMAEKSRMVQDAHAYLQGQIKTIQSPSLRALIENIYADTTPLLAALDAKQKTAVYSELSAKGYTKQAEKDVLPSLPQNPAEMKTLSPAVAAPGSGYGSHHAYPGGLMTHVAANVKLTNALIDGYSDVYGYNVDRDTALASQLLHDLHKPYVFQWQPDFSSRTEQSLAGTGEHHVLSIAEVLVRKAPAELVVAQACAHTHPGTPADEAQVVNWLKAAAIIAGVDPVKYGILAADGQTLPQPRRQEGFLCHLGDHDFVLSVPAVQWTLPVLQEIAVTDYGISEQDLKGKPFNALRNYVYAQHSAMSLHNDYAQGGKERVREVVRSLVTA